MVWVGLGRSQFSMCRIALSATSEARSFSSVICHHGRIFSISFQGASISELAFCCFFKGCGSEVLKSRSSKLLSEEYLVKDAENIRGGSNKSGLFSTLVPNVSHSNGFSGLGFGAESSTFFSQTSLIRSFWLPKFGCR
jgi:hypothetical protein